MDHRKKYSVKEYFSEILRRNKDDATAETFSADWRRIRRRDKEDGHHKNAGTTTADAPSARIPHRIINGTTNLNRTTVSLDPRQASLERGGKQFEALQNKNLATDIGSNTYVQSSDLFCPTTSQMPVPPLCYPSSDVSSSYLIDVSSRAQDYHHTNEVTAATIVSYNEQFEKEIGLPPYWKSARDSEGHLYYYHVFTRKSQWVFPTAISYCEQPEEPSRNSNDEMDNAEQTVSNSENEIRESRFKSKLSSCVFRLLKTCQKADCLSIPITTTTVSEDSKRQVKKLLDYVTTRELKFHKKNHLQLRYTKNVKDRATNYIQKYVSNFNPKL